MSAGARTRRSGRPTLIRKTIAARTFRFELLLAEHTRSGARSRPRWSLGLGSPTLGYVPSSRFQTPARSLRHGRIAFDPGLFSDRSLYQRSLWWSQTGSNRRPHACKARALPTELWPHL